MQRSENGGIEADEAAEKRAEAQERITTLVNEGRPERPGREGRQERRQESAQEMADLIGVEVEALTDWLRNGGTLAEIAEQNDVDPEAVVELIVENMTERIDQAVENGRIDAEEVDEALAEIEERATTRVNEGRPERGEGEASVSVATVGPAGRRCPRRRTGGRRRRGLNRPVPPASPQRRRARPGIPPPRPGPRRRATTPDLD